MYLPGNSFLFNQTIHITLRGKITTIALGMYYTVHGRPVKKWEDPTDTDPLGSK
jgi:hypothetical protein